MSDPGAQLRKNNDQIVHYLTTLKTQRNEINQLIQKQEDEMKKLQQEVERITYKIALVAKKKVFFNTKKKIKCYFFRSPKV